MSNFKEQILNHNKTTNVKVVVYPTEQFVKNVPTGLEGEILDFVSKIVKTDPRLLKSVLKTHGKFLKKRIRKYRIITWLKYIADFPVLIILDIMSRGDSNYESFNYDAEVFEAQYLSLMESEINIIENFLKTLPKPVGKEILPPEFYQWLHRPAFLHDTSETLIFESSIWYEKIQTYQFQPYLSRFYDILYNLFGNLQDLKIAEIKSGVNRAYLAQKPEYSVVFTQLKPDDFEGNVLFLIQPVIGNVNINEDDVNQWGAFKIRKLEEISRISYRAYPYYVLADETIWREIEQDLQANLALSSEEEKILNLISSPENPELPVFINGRAGSGKSTILYYLFADYCYKKYTENLRGDPLFLTYSPALSETAFRTVEKILHSNSKFAGRHEINADRILRFFKTFNNLLLEIIPDELKENFDPEKRISLYTFKQMWKSIHQRIPEHISPELAWFIIRAYIKGYDESEFMTPEDYHELPKKEKTVDEETFEFTYNYIWNWYKNLCNTESYWDDQDLVRSALNNLDKSHLPEYPVIFCDEAQDFTRIELRFIMRLSVFDRYQITYGVKSIPFVFAGDPMQTINPTGFRWEKTKSIFHEEIISELDPQNKFGINISFEPLSKNYRSTPAITKFSNIVLMWRSVLFDRELKPQIPWRTQEGTNPMLFTIYENISSENLKKLLKDKIVIIPVEEEQIHNFIKQDNYLSQIFPENKDNFPPQNIFTPMLAKGLEFDDVVVYKFGEHFDKLINANNQTEKRKLADILGNPQQISFDVEYFFNKLYVAITRAKKNLYIVDTKEGNEVLWDFTTDVKTAKSIIPADVDLSIWTENINPAQHGDQRIIFYTPEEKRKIAQELKFKGITQNEPSFLRRASQFFNEIGEKNEAIECLAYALKFERNYRDSSQQFELISKFDEQKECLILGKLWDELYKFYEKYPQYQNEPSFEVIKFICLVESNPRNSIISFVKFLKTYLQSGVNLEKLKIKPEWETAISKLSSIITQSPGDLLDQETWCDSGYILSKFFGTSKNILNSAALAYFYAREFKSATTIWEKIEETNHEKYYIAKASTLEPPDNLRFLLLAKQYDEIINLWESKDYPVDGLWFECVNSALNETKQLGKLSFLYLKVDNKQNAIDKFSEFVKSETNADEILKLTQQLLDLLDPEKNASDENYLKTSLEIIKLAFENEKLKNKSKLELIRKYFGFIPYSSYELSKNKEISEKFYEVFSSVIKSDWKNLKEIFNAQELCALLERTLSFVNTLLLYYDFIEKSIGIKNKVSDLFKVEKTSKEQQKIINKILQRMSYDPDLTFIVLRMAKVKFKQAEYHKNRGEKEDYTKHFNELKQMCQIFNLELSEIEDEPGYPEALPIDIEFKKFKTQPRIIKTSIYEYFFTHLFFNIQINVKTKSVLIVNSYSYTQNIVISPEEKTDYPKEFIISPFKVIINVPEQNVISLEFQSKETGTWTPEGTAIIKFKK